MLSDLPGELFVGLGAFPTEKPPAQAEGGYPQSIAAQICHLCTDAFADFCAVYLRSAGPEPVAFASRSESIRNLLADVPFGEDFEARAYDAGITAIVSEPLVVNERRIGTIVTGMSAENALGAEGRRSFSVLSSVLSTAVEQAQQLEHHYRVSKRLQRAMLPAQLAAVDGVKFDAAYRPASDEADVGGDWYDAFELGNGKIGISVGDVTGHGLEAAVAMSEIRRAIRAAAPSHESPAALMNYVDTMVASQGIGMATAIVGYYDPENNTLKYSCAGHPNPVLLSPSGRALFLPGGGLLLGLGMNPASQDWTVTLPPSSTCFLYTDGLLEYSRDVIAGERDLLRAVEALGQTPERTADALHTEIFNGSIQNTDDCATLALHHAEVADRNRFMLHYSSFPLSAALAREALRSFFDGISLTEERRFEILAAAGEAIANAIEHGEHEPSNTFTVEGSIDDSFITLSVENRGHWRPFVPREERGRGVPIMRAYSQGFEISSTSDFTRVTLSFKR